MKILDRYVLASFVKNYLISLMVLLGLYVVLDMVFSFDELAEVQQKTQITGSVRDLTHVNQQLYGTLTLNKNQTAQPGTEFKIAGVEGKSIGLLTVEESNAQEVRGPIKLNGVEQPRKGSLATAPSPSGSAVAVFLSVLNYYYHRCFLFFVQLSGVIPVVAAAFTLIRMSRFNELTAILAAGVPLLRVAMPIVYAGVVINFILLPIAQEMIIPGMIPQLTKKHDELAASGAKTFPVRAMQDESGALLNVGRYTPADGEKPAAMEIVDVIERSPAPEHRVIGHISADSAVFDADAGQWILTNGQRVTGLGPNEAHTPPQPVAAWKTSISPEEISLYRDVDYVELLSTSKINRLLERPNSYGIIPLRRVVHFRFSQLLINIILLLLAIPCVLTREPGTLKTDVTKCVFLTGLCMASFFIAHQMAGNPPMSGNMLHQWPLIMAWTPIFLFLPLAIFLLDQKHAKRT